jgi:hypothetical protein
MSAELSLLRCFCDRKDLYDKYYPYVVEVHNIDYDIKLLLNAVRDYYNQYNKDNIKEKDFVTFYDFLYPTAKNRVLHVELIHSIFEMDVNIELAQDIMEQFMERHYAAQIFDKIKPIIDGSKSGILPDVAEQVASFTRRMQNPPPDIRALKPHYMEIEDLVAKEINPKGLTWPIAELNNAIGVLRPKTFGLEFAYVDAGKTSFMTACVAHWARQISDEQNIVIAGNEEASARTDLRITQSLTGWTKEQIAADHQKAEQMRYERGYSRIKIFDSVTHTDHVLKLLEEYHPVVLAVDQLTKVAISIKSTRDIKVLEALANWFRERAKEFDCSIMGVTQGVGDALNKKWLELTDIYDSRVAIQGELDWAIGIGRDTKDITKENMRFISIPKNKFGEHSSFVVHFNKHNNVWRAL